MVTGCQSFSTGWGLTPAQGQQSPRRRARPSLAPTGTLRGLRSAGECLRWAHGLLLLPRRRGPVLLPGGCRRLAGQGGGLPRPPCWARVSGRPSARRGRLSRCLLLAPLTFQAPLRARLPGGGPGGRLLGPPPAVPELPGSAARPPSRLSQPSLAPTAATAVGPSPKRGLPGREPPRASESEPGCGQ